MKQITVLDTSVGTQNLGDEIIMDAVMGVVDELFPDAFVCRLPTHERLGPYAYQVMRDSGVVLVGGTNLLASSLSRRKKLWRIDWRDALHFSPVVLLGTGWRRQSRPAKRRTRWTYQRILHRELTHAVRDEHARSMLVGAGVPNVVNTACPTMWSLTPEHCRSIPAGRAEDVITTLTAYAAHEPTDRALLETLAQAYRRVYFWPQQREDLAYARALAGDRLTILPPRLAAYDDLLRREAVDYVGTRLHGGIRALQHRRRTLILSVDHRASAIAEDTALPHAPRDDSRGITQWIAQTNPIEIRLPTDAIQRWKDQFRSV